MEQETFAMPEVPDWRMVGELYNSYIIVEQGDNAFLIDKHAAHERILFEKLKANQEKISSQALLSPISVRLSPSAAGELLAMLPVRAELIVHAALLVVLEDFVGFVDLLELVFSGLVAGVQVGVILAGELFVRLRYLIFARRTLNAQQLVIILVFYSHFLSPEWRFPPYRY